MKAFFFILLGAALCVLGDEDITVKTYTVDFADPEEIAAVAPLMIDSTNRLVIRTVKRQLVVRGTAGQHTVIRQMIRDLDRPPKNIQVHVEFTTTAQSRQNEAGIRTRGPLSIYDGKAHGSLEGRLGSRETTTHENTTQMLVAMEGRSATLRVGERVPYLSWLIEYGFRHGYVQEVGIEWEEVGSFLAIEPAIVAPGLIRVRVIPELSGRLRDGTRQTIQFTHLATEVTAADGQTIRIGGFSQDKNFSSKFLIGTTADGQSVNTEITLTPNILN